MTRALREKEKIALPLAIVLRLSYSSCYFLRCERRKERKQEKEDGKANGRF